MSTDIEKQFAGNYVRLVNQNRQLQQAFDNSTQLNNALHDEIRLKDKMIELMAKEVSYYTLGGLPIEAAVDFIHGLAVEQLVAEQNKKAAEGSDVI